MKRIHSLNKYGLVVVSTILGVFVWAGAAAAADWPPTELGAQSPQLEAAPGPSGDWYGDGPMPLMPDDNSVINDGRAPALTFSYYTVSGATLRGRESTAGYTYQGLGCTSSTTAAERWLNTELPIPDGATIKYLRIYYYDTNATGTVSAYLTRYQPGQTTDDLTNISSTAAFASGNGTSLSPELTHVVDNTNYAYTLLALTSTAISTLRICGMRVAYYAP